MSDQKPEFEMDVPTFLRYLDEIEAQGRVMVNIPISEMRRLIGLLVPPEATYSKGEKSRPLFTPARSIAQEGDTHLYVFHNGLWYHFAPKGWSPKVSEPQNGK